MALSGDSGWIGFASYNTFGLRVTWSATQSVSGNYSDVSVTYQMRSTNSGSYFDYTSNAGLQINGTSYDRINERIVLNPNATITLKTQKVRVNHNSDGTKSFSIFFNFSNPVTGSSGTKSTSVNLNKIPRVSSLTWDSSVFPHSYGKEVRLTINSGSSDFYHSIEVRTRGVLRGAPLMNAKGGGVKAFTIPLGWLNSAVDTQVETCSFRLITHTKPGSYASDSLIGFVDYSGQLAVPDNIVPTISSVTYKDVNSTIVNVTGSDQILVQGKSIPQMNVQSSGVYGSTISQFKFEIGNTTYTHIGYTYNIDLSNLQSLKGTQTVKVTVTDSRGRTATMNDTLDIRAYAPPTLTNVSGSRLTSPTTTLSLTKTAVVSSIKNGTTEKNTYTVVTRYKKSTDTAWTTAKTETNANANFQLTGFSVTDSYDFEITLTDKFGSTKSTLNIATLDNLFNFYRDIGVGIGKLYEPGHGALDVGDMIWMLGRSLIDTFYPIGSIFQSTNSTSPSTFMGGTWERYGNGSVLVGVNESDSDFNAPGKTGGEKMHKLDTSASKATNEIGATSVGKEIPNSGDGLTITARFAGRVAVFLDKTIEANPHNNLQPYTTVYMWRRTA